VKKSTIATLPPIAVEERPEKLTLSFPTDLKNSMEQFGQFFSDACGETPISFNAVVVGILTGYLENHRPYQKWLKARSRTSAHANDPGAPKA
jgi:hypothetical protein